MPEPPADAAVRMFGPTLASLRHFGADLARTYGWAHLVDDVALVVGELATNSVHYGGGGGTLRLWSAGDAMVCETTDRGRTYDPLVGRRRPADGQLGGRGLWLVNQLAELVQVRSGPTGTTVRVRLPALAG